MKVLLNVSRAGIGADGDPFSQSAGDVIDVPSEEAKRLIEDGQGSAVSEKKIERAEKRDKAAG